MMVVVGSVCVLLLKMMMGDEERVERAGRMFGFRARYRGCLEHRPGAMDHPTRGEARYR
jgi:hypothetical protein